MRSDDAPKGGRRVALRHNSVAHDWVILARTANRPPIDVQRFLESAFASEEVLVEMNRFTGGLFILPEAAEFSAPHVGRETLHSQSEGLRKRPANPP